MSSEKLNLWSFLDNFIQNKHKNAKRLTRDDVVNLVKSPVTKELLKEEDFSTLEKLQDEDTFRSISDFHGKIASYESSFKEEDLKAKMATTAERAVRNLFFSFGTLRDGITEDGAYPWEFSSYNPTITEDEIGLLSDYTSGKFTLDEVIKKCNSKGFKTTEELESSPFHHEAATVFKNIAMLKPEVKEKVVDILNSVKTFLGNFDSNNDGKTSILEILLAGQNDEMDGISLKDIAIQVKKPY